MKYNKKEEEKCNGLYLLFTPLWSGSFIMWLSRDVTWTRHFDVWFFQYVVAMDVRCQNTVTQALLVPNNRLNQF